MIKGTWEQHRGPSRSLSASAPLQPRVFAQLCRGGEARWGHGLLQGRAGCEGLHVRRAVLPSCSPRAAQGRIPALCCTTPAAWSRDELKGKGRGTSLGSGAASSTTPLGWGSILHPAQSRGCGQGPL